MKNKENTMLLEEIIRLQEQDPQHYLSPENITALSEQFGIPEHLVLDTATFYSDISLEPRGKYIIQICKSPCCHVGGGLAVKNSLYEKLGIRQGETTADGLFTVEEVGCIGACDQAPAMLINGRLYGDLTAEKAAEIIEGLVNESC